MKKHFFSLLCLLVVISMVGCQSGTPEVVYKKEKQETPKASPPEVVVPKSVEAEEVDLGSSEETAETEANKKAAEKLAETLSAPAGKEEAPEKKEETPTPTPVATKKEEVKKETPPATTVVVDDTEFLSKPLKSKGRTKVAKGAHSTGDPVHSGYGVSRYKGLKGDDSFKNWDDEDDGE